MAPAFSNLRQAVAFCVLLLVTILLPALGGRHLLPPRDAVYSSVSWEAGAYPYLQQQIFEETGDIDIAFMGSSSIWWGLDAGVVQQAMTEKLGRPAVVRSLCWNWNGAEALYFIARDLLAHRKVRVLVINMSMDGTGNTAHVMAPKWFRFGDDAHDLRSLAFRSQASFYACAVLGIPRNVLGVFRSNLPPIASPEIAWSSFNHVPTPMEKLGSLAVSRGWDDGAFQSFSPPVLQHAGEVEISPGPGNSNTRFFEQPIYPMQVTFLQKFAQLTEEHGVKVVFLQMPDADDFQNPQLDFQQIWPAHFQDKVTWLGIPPARLFAGMTEAQVHALYYHPKHMNANGQEYFTAIITPALTRIFEENSRH